MAKYSPETRERLMKNETSIRAVVPFSNGHVVTLGFPGLAFDIQGEAFIDPGTVPRNDGRAGSRALPDPHRPCRNG